MVLEFQIQGLSLEHLYFGHWNLFGIWNLNMIKVKIVCHAFPYENKSTH